ncbi:unnamed protein product [Symbiodinium necroappetens]|uniref:Uncharacterized protein n=1 Tax=Symbiodinium necroappetens TaxID=1628268 RepID=A0A812X7Z5_9DINO|nr:unnamed protein product [Symbiodinium necroappetens]
MLSPSKPHAHGEHTTHKRAASNAVEALPSMPHAHEKHRQSCDEVRLVKLQKFLTAVDRNPKRLEKMIAARRRFFGLSATDHTTSSKTSMGHLNPDFKSDDDCSVDQPTIAIPHVCGDRACNRRTVSL